MGLEDMSDLQKLRLEYKPRLPPVLESKTVNVVAGFETAPSEASDRLAVLRAFPKTSGQPLFSITSTPVAGRCPGAQARAKATGPLKVGVVFSGRQSPGGHTIISGLYDALKAQDAGSSLVGFVDGCKGILHNKVVEITPELLGAFRNQGGYDMLGRSADQIQSDEQRAAAKATVAALKLDGLVMIGGTGTATDAAYLAEYFAAQSVATRVVAVPCTIDCDLKNPFVEVSVGFDTACKVYSQLISNICTDALSAEKYYYFIRLMGRKASHIALESSLQSQANMVILGEQVAASKMTLFDITNKICDAISERSAAKGKHHGVILIPEGLIEHIPEIASLIDEINGLVKDGVPAASISSRLSPWSAALFNFMPPFIRSEFVEHREDDGSLRFAQIETEKLMAHLVEKEMARRSKAGVYKGKKFNAISYFFGYQARGSLPSNFDCDYANALGHTAAHLIAAGANGYMTTVNGLKNDVNRWALGGVPITALLSCKQVKGGVTNRPAVNATKVDLNGPAVQVLYSHAASWLMDDLYRNPGPIQFEGPGSASRPLTLTLEDHSYVDQMHTLHKYLDQVKELVKPGCAPEALNTALSSLASLTQVLNILSGPAHTGFTAGHPGPEPSPSPRVYTGPGMWK
eukprot:TRINITY_DN7290_c0_g1_i1.p1 TRINITY_DN7290_c0_g1~~TRINITY_DN7290_c0_g1_i1.p1  ORF type:complete len:633 (+),score=42.67 TRINITY_DN7290_c0_g1_i1:166-2064(+)